MKFRSGPRRLIGNCAAALLMFALPAGIANAQSAARIEAQPLLPEVSEAPPPSEVLEVLVQSTLASLNQANLTGDYRVFLALSSSEFQRLNSNEQMAANFSQFRKLNIDLAPAVLYKPRWTAAPAIEGGVLRMSGKLPTRPQEINFNLAFVRENGRWRVAGISVGLSAPVTGK